jgi:hypothetical protein
VAVASVAGGLSTFGPESVSAQDPACVLLCVPALNVEPTLTFESLGDRPRIESEGAVARSPRETVFELIFAVDVPTEIPRVGLSLEAILVPDVVELEFELNLELVDEGRTGGWISSHVDVVDKFSPGERPTDGSAYTHKLDFEWDTALHALSWLPEGNWLRNLEVELSLDYLATGLPRAGDSIDGELYLDDASPWSLSLVLVAPLAPFHP